MPEHIHDEHTNVSTGGKRTHHRPKRAKEPKHMKDWSKEDQLKYHQSTIFLRNVKAAQRQCQYLRLNIKIWAKIKLLFKAPLTYSKELRDYRKTLKAFNVIPKAERVDLEPFQ